MCMLTIDFDYVKAALPPRDPAGHKGDFGKVYVLVTSASRRAVRTVRYWSCTAFPAAAPPQPHSAAHSSSGNMIFFTVSLLFGKAFRYSTSFSA